jgi:uncharacterized protein YjbI with pentapeptide repeats
MHRAKLCSATLIEANLRGTSLFQADLTGAILRHSDFTGANLREADLTMANLDGAILYGVQNLGGWALRNANNVHRAHLPPGMLADAVACGYKVPKD